MNLDQHIDNAKAIIFDMDGVLVDTEPIHMLVEREVFQQLNIEISDDYHQTFVGRSSAEMWAEVKARFNLQYSVDAITEIKRDLYIKHLEALDRLPLMEGIPELLKYLTDSGKYLALASSSAKPNIEYIIDRCGIAHHFKVVVSGHNLPKSKPDPAIFLLAADLLSVPPNECIVIEDSTAGIAAALSAGMYCIGYKGAYETGQDISKAHWIINNYQSLIK